MVKTKILRHFPRILLYGVVIVIFIIYTALNLVLNRLNEVLLGLGIIFIIAETGIVDIFTKFKYHFSLVSHPFVLVIPLYGLGSLMEAKFGIYQFYVELILFPLIAITILYFHFRFGRYAREFIFLDHNVSRFWRNLLELFISKALLVGVLLFVYDLALSGRASLFKDLSAEYWFAINLVTILFISSYIFEELNREYRLHIVLNEIFIEFANEKISDLVEDISNKLAGHIKWDFRILKSSILHFLESFVKGEFNMTVVEGTRLIEAIARSFAFKHEIKVKSDRKMREEVFKNILKSEELYRQVEKVMGRIRGKVVHSGIGREVKESHLGVKFEDALETLKVVKEIAVLIRKV